MISIERIISFLEEVQLFIETSTWFHYVFALSAVYLTINAPLIIGYLLGSDPFDV